MHAIRPLSVDIDEYLEDAVRAKHQLDADRWRAELQFKQQSALVPVAVMTGGWTEFLETPAQAEQIYSRIFSDINERYIVGYYPTNKERDGRRRQINIEVKGHPEYVISGRKSFQRPMDEGVALLNAIQDVYLDTSITVA